MRKTKFLLLFIVFAIISSCKTMNVYIPVLEPAPITVPSKIKNVVVVNRTFVADDRRSQAINILEGALSQQIPFQDFVGAEACTQGVAEQLNNLPRFKAVVSTKYRLNGTGTHQMANPLDWAFINELCKENNVDAVLSLEVFTTDNIHDVKPMRRETKDKNGKITGYYTEYIAHLGMRVHAGWRIYEPATKQIVDQSTFVDERAWDGSGSTQIIAISNCPSQMEMTKQGGYYAGNQYAYRISPKWITVTRSLYKKGNDDFVLAARMCSSGQWTEAGNIYRKFTEDMDPKMAGRACHNLAVICEVNGDLDAAINWTQKAYANYGLKNSRYYYNSLVYRKNAERKLGEQMKE